MEIIEVEYGESIKCPFCGKTILSDEGFGMCPHVVFEAVDDGFEYAREDCPVITGEEPEEECSAKLEAQGFDLEEAECDFPGVNERIENCPADGCVCYARYDPAPSFYGAYVGFSGKKLS